MLVVKDPPPASVQQCWEVIPGLLGMNVISECYHELFDQHGAVLFTPPLLQQFDFGWVQVLRQCPCLEATSCRSREGKIKVRGKDVVHIPAGTMKFVISTCLQSGGSMPT